MCACEPGFTCSRCADTPHDPAYPELPDAPEPESDPWTDPGNWVALGGGAYMRKDRFHRSFGRAD